jgi:hypothetical protein
MRSVILLSNVVSALMTAVAVTLVLPAMAGAEASQVQAQSVTVVTAEGKPVLRFSATPFNTGQIQLLAADGSVRIGAAAGGPVDSPNPLNAGLNIFYAGSVGNGLAARMGLDDGNPQFQLLDKADNIRFLAALDNDGNASIQLLDARGKVTWSAPPARSSERDREQPPTRP